MNVSRGWLPPREAWNHTSPCFTLWLSRWEGGGQPTEAARAVFHDDLAPSKTALASKREALPTPLQGTIMQ